MSHLPEFRPSGVSTDRQQYQKGDVRVTLDQTKPLQTPPSPTKKKTKNKTKNQQDDDNDSEDDNLSVFIPEELEDNNNDRELYIESPFFIKWGPTEDTMTVYNLSHLTLEQRNDFLDIFDKVLADPDLPQALPDYTVYYAIPKEYYAVYPTRQAKYRARLNRLKMLEPTLNSLLRNGVLESRDNKIVVRSASPVLSNDLLTNVIDRYDYQQLEFVEKSTTFAQKFWNALKVLDFFEFFQTKSSSSNGNTDANIKQKYHLGKRHDFLQKQLEVLDERYYEHTAISFYSQRFTAPIHPINNNVDFDPNEGPNFVEYEVLEGYLQSLDAGLHAEHPAWADPFYGERLAQSMQPSKREQYRQQRAELEQKRLLIKQIQQDYKPYSKDVLFILPTINRSKQKNPKEQKLNNNNDVNGNNNSNLIQNSTSLQSHLRQPYDPYHSNHNYGAHRMLHRGVASPTASWHKPEWVKQNEALLKAQDHATLAALTPTSSSLYTNQQQKQQPGQTTPFLQAQKKQEQKDDDEDDEIQDQLKFLQFLDERGALDGDKELSSQEIDDYYSIYKAKQQREKDLEEQRLYNPAKNVTGNFIGLQSVPPNTTSPPHLIHVDQLTLNDDYPFDNDPRAKYHKPLKSNDDDNNEKEQSKEQIIGSNNNNNDTDDENDDEEEQFDSIDHIEDDTTTDLDDLYDMDNANNNNNNNTDSVDITLTNTQESGDVDVDNHTEFEEDDYDDDDNNNTNIDNDDGEYVQEQDGINNNYDDDNIDVLLDTENDTDIDSLDAQNNTNNDDKQNDYENDAILISSPYNNNTNTTKNTKNTNTENDRSLVTILKLNSNKSNDTLNNQDKEPLKDDPEYAAWVAQRRLENKELKAKALKSPPLLSNPQALGEYYNRCKEISRIDRIRAKELRNHSGLGNDGNNKDNKYDNIPDELKPLTPQQLRRAQWAEMEAFVDRVRTHDKTNSTLFTAIPNTPQAAVQYTKALRLSGLNVKMADTGVPVMPDYLTYDDIVKIKKTFVKAYKANEPWVYEIQLPPAQPLVINNPYELNPAQQITYNELQYLYVKYDPFTKAQVLKQSKDSTNPRHVNPHTTALMRQVNLFYGPNWKAEAKHFWATQQQLYGITRYSQVRPGFLAQFPFLQPWVHHLTARDEHNFYSLSCKNKITPQILEMWDRQHIIANRHVYGKDDDLLFLRAIYYKENQKRYNYIQSYNEWEIDAKNALRLKLELGIRYEQHLQQTRRKVQYRAAVSQKLYPHQQHDLDAEGKPKDPELLKQWANRTYDRSQGERERYPPNEPIITAIKQEDSNYLYDKYIQNEYEESLKQKQKYKLKKQQKSLQGNNNKNNYLLDNDDDDDDDEGYYDDDDIDDHGNDPFYNNLSPEDVEFVKEQQNNRFNKLSLDELMKKYILESLPKEARIHPPIRTAVFDGISVVPPTADEHKIPPGLEHEVLSKPKDIYEALLFNPIAPQYGDGLKLDTFIDVQKRVDQNKYPIFELIHDDELTAEDIKKQKQYEEWLAAQRDTNPKAFKDARAAYNKSEFYYGSLQNRMVDRLQDQRLRQHNLLLSVLTPKQYDELLEFKGFAMYPNVKSYINDKQNNSNNNKNKNKKHMSSDGKINFLDPRFTNIGPPPALDYIDAYQNQAEINHRFGYTPIELKTPLTSNFQLYAQAKRYQYEKNKLFEEAEQHVKEQMDLYGSTVNKTAVRNFVTNQQNVIKLVEDRNEEVNKDNKNDDQNKNNKNNSLYLTEKLSPDLSNNLEKINPQSLLPNPSPRHQPRDVKDVIALIEKKEKEDPTLRSTTSSKNKKDKHTPLLDVFDSLGWEPQHYTASAMNRFVEYRTKQLLNQWVDENVVKHDLTKHFSKQDRLDLQKEFQDYARKEAQQIWGTKTQHSSRAGSALAPPVSGAGVGLVGFINDDEIEGRILATSSALEKDLYPNDQLLTIKELDEFNKVMLNAGEPTTVTPIPSTNYVKQLNRELTQVELSVEQAVERLPAKPRYRFDRKPGEHDYTISTGIRQLDAELETFDNAAKIKTRIYKEMLERQRNIRRKLFVQHLSTHFPLQPDEDVFEDYLKLENKKRNNNNVVGKNNNNRNQNESNNGNNNNENNNVNIPKLLPEEEHFTGHEVLLYPYKSKHQQLYEYKQKLHHHPKEYRRLIWNYIRDVTNPKERELLMKDFFFILNPEASQKVAYCDYFTNLAPTEQWRPDHALGQFYDVHLNEYTRFLSNQQTSILKHFNDLFYFTQPDVYDHKNDEVHYNKLQKDWTINDKGEFEIEYLDYATKFEEYLIEKLFNLSPTQTQNIPQQFKDYMFLPQELNTYPVISWLSERTDLVYQDPFARHYLDEKTHINYPLIKIKRDWLLYHYYTNTDVLLTDLLSSSTTFNNVINKNLYLTKKLLITPLITILRYVLFKPLHFLNKPLGLVQKEAQEYFDETLFPLLHFSSNSHIRNIAKYLAPLLTNFEEYQNTMSLFSGDSILATKNEYGSNLFDTISYRKEALKWLGYRNAEYGTNGQLLLDGDVDLTQPELKNKLFSKMEKLFTFSPYVIGHLPSIHKASFNTLYRHGSEGEGLFPQPTRLLYDPYDMSILADTTQPIMLTTTELATLLDIPSAGHSALGLAQNAMLTQQQTTDITPQITKGSDVNVLNTNNAPWKNPELLNLEIPMDRTDDALLAPVYQRELLNKMAYDDAEGKNEITNEQTLFNQINHTATDQRSYFELLYPAGSIIDLTKLNKLEEVKLLEEQHKGLIALAPADPATVKILNGGLFGQFLSNGQKNDKYVQVFYPAHDTNPVQNHAKAHVMQENYHYISKDPKDIKVHIPLSVYTPIDEYDIRNTLPEEHSMDAVFKAWVVKEREKQYTKLNQYAIEKTEQWKRLNNVGNKNNNSLQQPSTQIDERNLLPALPLKLTAYDLLKYREEVQHYKAKKQKENLLQFIHHNWITPKNYRKYNLLKFKDNEEIVDVRGNEVIIRSKNTTQRTFDSHMNQIEQQREIFFAWLDFLKTQHKKKLDKFFVQRQRLHTQLYVDDRTGKVVERPLTAKQLHEYDKYQQQKFGIDANGNPLPGHNQQRSKVDRIDELLNPEVLYQKTFSPILHSYQRHKTLQDNKKHIYIDTQRNRLLRRYRNVNFAQHLPHYKVQYDKNGRNKAIVKKRHRRLNVNKIPIGELNDFYNNNQQKVKENKYNLNLRQDVLPPQLITTPHVEEIKDEFSIISLLTPIKQTLSPLSQYLPKPIQNDEEEDEDDYDGIDELTDEENDFFSKVDTFQQYDYKPELHRLAQDNNDYTFATTLNPYKPPVNKGDPLLQQVFAVSQIGQNPMSDTLQQLPERYFTMTSGPFQHYQIYEQSVLAAQYEGATLAKKLHEHQTILNTLKKLVPNNEYRAYLREFKQRRDYDEHQKLLARTRKDEQANTNFFQKIWPFGTKKLHKTDFSESSHNISILAPDYKPHEMSQLQSSNPNVNSGEFTDWFDESSNTRLDEDTKKFLKHADEQQQLANNPKVSPAERHLIERLVARLYNRADDLNNPATPPLVMNPDLDILERQTQLPGVMLSFDAFRRRYNRKLAQQHYLRKLLRGAVDVESGGFRQDMAGLFKYLDPNVKSYDLLDLDDYTEFPQTPFYDEIYQPEEIRNDPAVLTKQMVNYLIFSGNSNILLKSSDKKYDDENTNLFQRLVNMINTSDNDDDGLDKDNLNKVSGNYSFNLLQYLKLKTNSTINPKTGLPYDNTLTTNQQQDQQQRVDMQWHQRFYSSLIEAAKKSMGYDNESTELGPDGNLARNNANSGKNQQKNNNKKTQKQIERDITEQYTAEEKDIIFNNIFDNAPDFNPYGNSHVDGDYQTPYIFHKVKQLLTNADKQQYLRHIAYKMDTLSLDIYQFEQLRLDGQFGYHPVRDRKLQKEENNIHLLTETDILDKRRLFLKYYYPDGTKRFDDSKLPHITAKQREENQITLMKAKYKQYQKMMVFLQHDLITLEDYNNWCSINYVNHNDEWFTHVRVWHVIVALPMLWGLTKTGLWFMSKGWNFVTNQASEWSRRDPIGKIERMLKHQLNPTGKKNNNNSNNGFIASLVYGNNNTNTNKDINNQSITDTVPIGGDDVMLKCVLPIYDLTHVLEQQNNINKQNNNNKQDNKIDLNTLDEIESITTHLHQLTTLASALTTPEQQYTSYMTSIKQQQHAQSSPAATTINNNNNNIHINLHKAYAPLLDLFQSPFFNNQLTKPYQLPHLYQVLLLFARCTTQQEVVSLFYDVYPYLQRCYGDIFATSTTIFEEDLNTVHIPSYDIKQPTATTQDIQERAVWLNWFLMVTAPQHSPTQYEEHVQQHMAFIDKRIEQLPDNIIPSNNVECCNFMNLHHNLLSHYETKYNRNKNIYITTDYTHLFTAWIQMENIINCLLSVMPYIDENKKNKKNKKNNKQQVDNSLQNKVTVLEMLLFKYQPILSLFILPYDIFTVDTYKQLQQEYQYQQQLQLQQQKTSSSNNRKNKNNNNNNNTTTVIIPNELHFYDLTMTIINQYNSFIYPIYQQYQQSVGVYMNIIIKSYSNIINGMKISDNDNNDDNSDNTSIIDNTQHIAFHTTTPVTSDDSTDNSTLVVVDDSNNDVNNTTTSSITSTALTLTKDVAMIVGTNVQTLFTHMYTNYIQPYTNKAMAQFKENVFDIDLVILKLQETYTKISNYYQQQIHPLLTTTNNFIHDHFNIITLFNSLKDINPAEMFNIAMERLTTKLQQINNTLHNFTELMKSGESDLISTTKTLIPTWDECVLAKEAVQHKIITLWFDVVLPNLVKTADTTIDVIHDTTLWLEPKMKATYNDIIKPLLTDAHDYVNQKWQDILKEVNVYITYIYENFFDPRF